MKKKLLTTLLGASLLLAACGGEKAADKPATEAETIKIGAMGPLTGPVAIYGISATNGLKLAVDEINANGGILGKQIELNLLDEKGDSTEAVNAYNKLVDWGMVALVGDITSKPSVAVAEVAAQDGIPMITPTGTQLNITEAGSNVFRVCFTDPYQGEVLAKFAKDKLEAKTVAIMSNNSSDYSDGVANAFAAEAEKQGIQVVAREGYSDGDKDFKAQLTKIAQQNPDVLFIPDYYEQDGLISIQAREVGLKSVIVGSDGWDGVVKTVDPSSYAAIEDVYFANHYSTKDTNEKVQNFIKNYKEKYNDEPSAFSALSYDTAYLLKAAIEKAGTTDKEAVAKAIKELEFEAARTGITEQEAKDNNINYKTVFVDGEDHAAYYPGGEDVYIKLIYNADTKVLLGAQVAGKKGAALRADSLAVAIQNKMTVKDLANMDFLYAPPFATTWDIMNVAGNVAK